MIDWSTVTYADLDADQRCRVDDVRTYVRTRALADGADELRADPSRAEEIADDLLADGHLGDSLSALRWVAATLAQPA